MELNDSNVSWQEQMINSTSKEFSDVFVGVAIVRVVFWAVLGVPTVLFNGLILRGLVLAKELPRPCRSLLVNMSFCDMLSGMTMIATAILFLCHDGTRWFDCIGAIALQSTLAIVSMFLSTLFPVNAYLSQLIPFLYRGMMSPPKIVLTFTIIWSIPILLVAMSLKDVSEDFLTCSPIFVFNWLDLRVFGGIYLTCMILMSSVYWKLYALARGHISKIVSQTHHEQRSTVNVSLQNKALKTVSLVVVSFILMYTPLALFMLVVSYGETKPMLLSDLLPKIILEFLLVTLFLAKSIMNPIVYSWKIPFVREVTHNLFNSTIRKNFQATTTAVTTLDKPTQFQKTGD